MRMVRWALLAVLCLCAGVAAPMGGYAAYLQMVGNVHAVDADGRLYRSGTLRADQLEALVREKGIRTIVNLRGGEGSDWLKGERAVAARNGVDFFNFHLSANNVPPVSTMQEIAAVLRNARGPVLVHCKAGSDRAGLAAGIYELAVAGQPLAEAQEQLSFYFGHFPWLTSTTGAMDKALVVFADAMAARRSPAESNALRIVQR